MVRFEELVVWRKARALTTGVYRLTAQRPLSRDFGLTDQLRRAAVSVMSNIAEGFESNTVRSFLRYLQISKASLAELRSQLYVVEDAGLVLPDRLGAIREQIETLGRALGGLINSLRAKLEVPHRG